MYWCLDRKSRPWLTSWHTEQTDEQTDGKSMQIFQGRLPVFSMCFSNNSLMASNCFSLDLPLQLLLTFSSVFAISPSRTHSIEVIEQLSGEDDLDMVEDGWKATLLKQQTVFSMLGFHTAALHVFLRQPSMRSSPSLPFSSIVCSAILFYWALPEGESIPYQQHQKGLLVNMNI